MNKKSRRELVVFGLLLVFAVIGRWLQPAWNFTPLMAVTALGGFYFRSLVPAVLLPVATLAISNLTLDSHDNWVVEASVYAMTLLPLWLGRRARANSNWRRAAYWGACGIVPATAFFIVTNFAVWATKSLYVDSLTGLIDCYVKALPFYRTMLAGDLCYVSLMVACLAAATAFERNAETASVRIKK
jgi:hypothetical protein